MCGIFSILTGKLLVTLILSYNVSHINAVNLSIMSCILPVKAGIYLPSDGAGAASVMDFEGKVHP